MEFKRNTMIALYLAGISQPVMVCDLKNLDVNKLSVYRTISCYTDTGSILNRH